jgi:4-aminobutyrate aminotransferase
MTWEAGSHASTFGGNPVSCRAAMATIELLQESLIENANVQGKRLMDGLFTLQKSYECMGDVRGKGLMVAVEFVKDREKRIPDAQIRDRIIQRAFNNGLLLLGCGVNSIRFCPALTASPDEIDVCLQIFDESVKTTV